MATEADKEAIKKLGEYVRSKDGRGQSVKILWNTKVEELGEDGAVGWALDLLKEFTADEIQEASVKWEWPEATCMAIGKRLLDDPRFK